MGTSRSFDNFFAKFPGANGLATTGTFEPQIGPDGKPYKFLPAAIDSNLKPAAEDTRFPAQLPNQPFEINPYVSLEEDTGDLIHAFYQEQMQINGGAMNRFAQISNAKGLVMAISIFRALTFGNSHETIPLATPHSILPSAARF